MKMLNEAIEGASDFRGMMDRITLAEKLQAKVAQDACGEMAPDGQQPLGVQRQPGENRAAHRARLKREGRAAKAVT